LEGCKALWWWCSRRGRELKAGGGLPLSLPGEGGGVSKMGHTPRPVWFGQEKEKWIDFDCNGNYARRNEGRTGTDLGWGEKKGKGQHVRNWSICNKKANKGKKGVFGGRIKVGAQLRTGELGRRGERKNTCGGGGGKRLF